MPGGLICIGHHKIGGAGENGSSLVINCDQSWFDKNWNQNISYKKFFVYMCNSLKNHSACMHCTQAKLKTLCFLLYIYLWFLDVLNGLYLIRYTGVLFDQFYILL